ncbi:MAG: hypothetical protein LBD10_12495 [Desulfobulbus sp.]|jgi:hypothetical protein|uniref:hypothetical protein n=1 Tax=Desulfobulbus sp. TaxID=895 RepID=UPI00283FD509|nr:hypothetical protein [Desulfobulbus sp.]MDR2551008.1 hypothetical protein [Desulfobulbus sp.]
MTPQDDQCIFLDELARRWRQSPDRIVELAVNGALPLWIGFTEVSGQKAARKAPGPRKNKAKPTAMTRYDRIEVRPDLEVLRQILGRCDRILIVAELACQDATGAPMVLTNSVGEEWGETSMIGLKPAALFARPEDARKFEQKNKIVPHTIHIKSNNPANPDEHTPLAAPHREHPCFAPELHAALACWQALFADATSPTLAGADIRAWLQRHYPDFSRAAMERIALVVTPSRNNRR